MSDEPEAAEKPEASHASAPPAADGEHVAADEASAPPRDEALAPTKAPAELPEEEGVAAVREPIVRDEREEAPCEEKPQREPAAAEAAAASAAPEAPAPSAANYDGLDSGLAWFGAETFQPPGPVGYTPLPEPAPRPAKELSAQERRRIAGCLEARRRDAEGQKAWYQRIPLGALSMVPVLLFLAVYTAMQLLRGSGQALPASREPLKAALLKAKPLPDSDEALRQLGVQQSVPACWEVLPGNIVRMTRAADTAKLVFAIPQGLGNFEVACDLCVLEHDEGMWSVTIALDRTAGLIIREHKDERGQAVVAGMVAGGGPRGYPHNLKPRMWDEVRVVVGEAAVTYFFNGKALKASPPRPGQLAKVELTTCNTQLLIRNWRIKPLDH